MDSGSFWIWGCIVVGVFIAWIWIKGRGQGLEGEENGGVTFKKQLLTWLQVADQEELTALRQQLELQRSELVSRLDRLEVTLTQQGRLDNWANEVNGRLCQLELSKTSPEEKEGLQHSNSKSILCLGVRATLMDQIWSELGIVNPEEPSDTQINKWIQGPFCRNCLRSLVVHGDQDDEKSVRTQCRYCSLPWREDSTTPILLSQVKREVYEYLHVAYRNNRERNQ